MNYSILIKLSRQYITFYYYTDDKGRFAAYGDESVRPLAIWLTGSDAVIGSDALVKSKTEGVNAYSNLFEVMTRQGHFDYANEKHDYNKLLLFVIRQGLKEFFSKMMFGTLGSLDDQISHIPLNIVFHPDVKDNERSVVMNQLRSNGFTNSRELNEDDFISDCLNPEEGKRELLLVLSSNATDLYGSIYAGRKLRGSFIKVKQGNDPRIDKIARIIFDRTGAGCDFLDFAPNEKELRAKAEAFIRTGQPYLDGGSITLSNGNAYSYYIEPADLTVYNNSDGTCLVHELEEEVRKYGRTSDCCVVFKDDAASNRYLQKLLAPEFGEMRVIDDATKEAIHSLILEDCKAKDFRFVQSPDKAKNKTADKPMQPEALQSPEPSPYDRRLFKELKLTVRTLGDSNSYDAAIDACQSFLAEMHDREVVCFDREVGEMIEQTKSKRVLHKPAPTVAVSSPSPHDHHTFKKLRLEILTLLKNGDNARARQQSEAFLTAMHAKGIDAFDKEAASLIPSGDSPESKDKATPKDKRRIKELRLTVETYLKAGRQSEAKREIAAFRNEMSRRNIHDFNSDLHTIAESLSKPAKASVAPPPPSSTKKAVAPPSVTPPSVKSEPSAIDRREFKRLKLALDTCTRLNDKKRASEESRAFLKIMHDKGFHQFDEEVKQLMKQFINQ